MNRTFLVAGEPALWLGSGYEAWKQTLADSVPFNHDPPSSGIVLEYRVSSLLRSGQRFDLDNLVSPVFQALLGKRASLARSHLSWWRASIAEYRPPALALSLYGEGVEALALPNADLVLDCRIAAPYPTNSREGGCDFVAAIRARLGSHAPGHDDRFAVEVAFGRDVKDISWVEERPLKPVMDCLYPVFGGSGGVPDDWKTFLIQVRRDDPGLDRECAVRVWRVGARANVTRTPPQVATVTVKTPVPQLIRADKPGSASVSNYERLDEAAKQLSSPPHELTLDDIIRRAKALYPEMASSPRDGLSASMDYQSINVKGRASGPGDFEKSDRWNRSPAFLKVGRGIYRRLTEEERALFRKLFDGGETLLRREAFDAAEWDALVRKHGH
jgi:hypothetical protein